MWTREEGEVRIHNTLVCNRPSPQKVSISKVIDHIQELCVQRERGPGNEAIIWSLVLCKYCHIQGEPGYDATYSNGRFDDNDVVLSGRKVESFC